MGKVVKMKKDEGDVELVHGIELRKLDKVAIDDAIEKLGLKLPKKGASLVERVALLKDHCDSVPAESMSGPCTNCGVASPIVFDACPFCGVGEDSESPQTGAPQAPTPNTAIVRKQVDATAVVRGGTVAELDARVAEIRQLNADAATRVYTLATKVNELDQLELWKLRRGEGGAVAYSKFAEFARVELGMTRDYVESLQRCAVNFSEEDFAKIGVSKLRLLLKFPEESQQEILEKLQDGAGAREIEKDLRDKKAKASKQHKGRDKAERGRAAPTNAITVAQVEGKHTLKMYARPSHRGEELRPARKLADQPFAVWDLANDVRMQFAVLQNAAGDLVLKVEVKRIVPGV